MFIIRNTRKRPLQKPCLFWTLLLIGLLATASFNSLLATPQKTKVLISTFTSYKYKNDIILQNELNDKLKNELQKNGFTVRFENFTTFKSHLESAKTNKDDFYISGFFSKPAKTKGLDFYAQIYDPDKAHVIDALHFSNDFSRLEGIAIDEKELASSESEFVSSFVKRIVIRLRSNPIKKIRYDNLNDYLTGTSISHNYNFPLPDTKKKKAKIEAFEILEEQEISIVSRRLDKAEKVVKTPAIVAVFSREQIENSGARNLTDILKNVPGVEIYYDQFGFYKISFRGIRSKSGVLLLLDGHRLNNFYDGSTFLDLRADVIEKVEIIRGPGSSIHGANAFVGVINVISRKVNKNVKSSGEFTLQKGSFHSFESNLFYAGKIFSWNYLALAHYYDTQGQKQRIKYDKTCSYLSSTGDCDSTFIPLRNRNDIYTNDAKTQNNLFLSFEHSSNHFLNLRYISEKRGPFIGPLLDFVPNSNLSFQHFLLDGGMKSYSLNKKIKFSAKLFTDVFRKNDTIEIERNDMISHPGKSAVQKLKYSSYTAGGEIIAQYNIFKPLVLMLGLSSEVQAVDSFEIKSNFKGTNVDEIFTKTKNYDGFSFEQNEKRLGLGSFLQGIYEIFTNLSLTLGLRYDYYSDFGTTLNPKGGLVYIPVDSKKWGRLSAKILYGTAFRAPTFQELYDQTQKYQDVGVFGNKNLKPEKIKTYEAGLEYRSPWKPLSVSSNVFYNIISDNIEGINVSGSYPSPNDAFKNMRGIETLGFEQELKLRLDSINYGFLNYSWLETKDKGGFPSLGSGDVITYRLDVPQWRINLGIMTGILPYINIYNSVWASSMRAANYRFIFETQDIRRFKIPAYALWNLRFASKSSLLKNILVSISIFNVLDTPVYDDFNIAEMYFKNRAFRKQGRYIEGKIKYVLR